MKKQFVMAYGGMVSGSCVRKLNEDIDRYEGEYHIVQMIPQGQTNVVIVLWEED